MRRDRARRGFRFPGVARVIALCMALAATALMVYGCYVNPATGKEQLSLYSESQEISMGREADPQIVASMGVYQDSAIAAYVDRLGRELAAVSERPDLPWTFRVIDDPVVNAFAVPGGFIYITRGIMAHLNSEAQLAGVVGHEIGHVTARHSVTQMTKQQLLQIGVGVGVMIEPDLQKYSSLINSGLQLMFLKFSRDDEKQADDLGLRYMVRDGKDPREMPGIFAMLKRVSENAGGGSIPEWMSTHPDPENRVGRLERAIDTLPIDFARTSVGRNSYLRLLDGMTYGTDPREGYFEGATFYHPDMAFQFVFPDGWQTYNDKQGVIAAGPNQDVLIQLTLAQGSTPQAAAESFFSQQGITSTARQTGNINGLAAVSADFQATTDNGVLAGHAAFVSHNGIVFQILGYSTLQGWTGYETAVRSSIRSFARLTDQSKLTVRPMRLKIETVSQAMTVEEFNRRYPSEVPLDEIALINQLQPSTQLPSGTLVKRVVR
ncbi:M48 family metalloprotease [bacterium]|nr:M48 family metalloprotease [bacterium]